MEFREIFKIVVIVLICLAVGGLFGSYLYKKSIDPSAGAPGDVAIAELHQQNQGLNARIGELTKQEEELKQEQSEKKQQILALQQQVVESRNEFNQQVLVLKKAAADYRQKYCALVRKQAIGEKYDTLMTLDHTVYQEVVLTKVDEGFIYFTHSKGAARISFTQLADEWKNRFDYQAEEATATSPASAEEGAKN